MSKYLCKKCHQPALYRDLISPISGHCAVYAACISCKREAFGGQNFHPEMNEVFNALFTPNFEDQSTNPLSLDDKVLKRSLK